MDILSILFTVVLLFLFPLGQVFRIDIGNGIAVNPLDVGVCVIAFISFIQIIKKKTVPNFVRPLGLFTLVGLLGLLFNVNTFTIPEIEVSSLYLLRFFLYTTVIIGVSFLRKEKKQYLWNVLLISGGIILIAGYIQYFFYQSLWNVLYEGWDPHLYRMFSTFLDPNFTGVFFVLYFLFVVDTWWEQKAGLYKNTLAFVALLGFLGVVLSFSRGAYVDFGISVVVYIFLKGYKKVALILPILVILLSVGIAYFLPYGEEKHLFCTASTKARLVSAENALTIFEKNPFVGVGFNAYRYAQHRYHLLNGFNWEDTHSGAGANNSYVFVLATTGILGGIAYGWFWIQMIKKSRGKVYSKHHRALFLFSAYIALLVSGMFENTLFYPSIMIWMFVLVGLTN